MTDVEVLLRQEFANVPEPHLVPAAGLASDLWRRRARRRAAVPAALSPLPQSPFPRCCRATPVTLRVARSSLLQIPLRRLPLGPLTPPHLRRTRF